MKVNFDNSNLSLAPLAANTYKVHFLSCSWVDNTENSGWFLLRLQVAEGPRKGKVFVGSISLGFEFEGLVNTEAQLKKLGVFAKKLGVTLSGEANLKDVVSLFNQAKGEQVIVVTIGDMYSTARTTEGYGITYVNQR